jgi:hypothetical protein
MPTVTVRLDADTDARLKRRLARSGETLSEFIRTAVTRQLDAGQRSESRSASLQRVLDGIADRGETDLSVTYKSRIRERARARHHR